MTSEPSGESVHGQYVRDPRYPAGSGWCEAIIAPRRDDPGNRYCYTKARFERSGHRVCGLHLHAGRCRWGAHSSVDADSTPEVADVISEPSGEDVRVDHFHVGLALTDDGAGTGDQREVIVAALREPRVAAHLHIYDGTEDDSDQYRINAVRLTLDAAIRVVADAVVTALASSGRDADSTPLR